MGLADRYYQLLAGLSQGGRNGKLLAVALAGRRAGFDSVQIEGDIHAFGDGADPLTNSEVQRAIKKANDLYRPGTFWQYRGGYYKARPRASHNTPKSGEVSFFERMAAEGEGWRRDNGYTGAGAGSNALYSLSPVKFSRQNGREQAALLINRLSTDWLGYTFAGDFDSPRDSEHLFQAESLACAIEAGELTIPQFIMVNQLSGGKTWINTGTGSGHYSMGTKGEIFHYRHALIEFDGYKEILPSGETRTHILPLETQVDFWIGAITSKTLIPVSLTYSGSKSIHGIIRLCELRDKDELDSKMKGGSMTLREHYAKLEGISVAELDDKRLWSAQWRGLERVLASSQDKIYHADMACKDATRQTRLAGHYRESSKRRQALLYMTLPNAKDYPRLDEEIIEAKTNGGPEADGAT